VIAGEARAEIEQIARLAQRKPKARDFEPATYLLGLLGRSTGAAAYVGAVRTLQLTARSTAPFFARFDVLLTPTLATPPALTGALQPTATELRVMRLINALNAGWLLSALGIIKQEAGKMFDYIPFTPLFNVTGQPAMSVPLHWNDAGLPIGMQFIGRLGDDATLIRLAGQLERARPWFERRAPGY
jgi:amidase